jgi:hypothetical protein
MVIKLSRPRPATTFITVFFRSNFPKIRRLMRILKARVYEQEGAPETSSPLPQSGFKGYIKVIVTAMFGSKPRMPRSDYKSLRMK